MWHERPRARIVTRSIAAWAARGLGRMHGHGRPYQHLSSRSVFFRSACIAGLVKSRSWREEYSIRQALRSAVLDSLDPSQVETASAAPMAPAIWKRRGAREGKTPAFALSWNNPCFVKDHRQFPCSAGNSHAIRCVSINTLSEPAHVTGSYRCIHTHTPKKRAKKYAR